MPSQATLECPDCGHEESPLRHTYQSRCGGEIYWHNGTLVCSECDTRISLFRCDECGSRLGTRNVS